MTDTLSPQERSERMRRIRSKDTAPELTVRRLAHGLGYRFRLHVKDLPGRPDLVFPGRRAVIQVNGCYWHGHDCKVGRRPKSNAAFWNGKIDSNRVRDARNIWALRALGWRVLLIWECETLPVVAEALAAKLVRFLDATGPRSPLRR